MDAVVLQERDKRLPLQAVSEQNGMHSIHYIFGSVHGQLECLEPRPRSERQSQPGAARVAVRSREIGVVFGIVPQWRLGLRPTVSTRRLLHWWMGAQVLQTFPEFGGVDLAEVAEPHYVLITDQIVRMFRHRRQGGLGRPGPTLGCPQIPSLEHAIDPELQERASLLDGPGQFGR